MLTRWQRYVPRYFGNDQAPAPFAVEVKVLRKGPFLDWLRRLGAWIEGGAKSEGYGALVEGVLRGPTEDVVFDGEVAVGRGDLAGLVALAVDEIHPDHQLALELVTAIREANGLRREDVGNSEAPAGGDGGTPDQTGASSPQPAAPAADASSADPVNQATPASTTSSASP